MPMKQDPKQLNWDISFFFLITPQSCSWRRDISPTNFVVNGTTCCIASLMLLKKTYHKVTMIIRHVHPIETIFQLGSERHKPVGLCEKGDLALKKKHALLLVVTMLCLLHESFNLNQHNNSVSLLQWWIQWISYTSTECKRNKALLHCDISHHFYSTP